jgi:hypothetical protein
MKLVYVFDYREATGYLFRAPVFIAKLFIKFYRGSKFYDYAELESGY